MAASTATSTVEEIRKRTLRPTGSGQPPRPPGRVSSVGSDFPEGDHEHFQIGGQPVVSCTLKIMEAGVEKQGIVFIEVNDPATRAHILENLSPGGDDRVIAETPPEDFASHARSGKAGIYVSDNGPLMDADTLHRMVKRDLNYMQTRSVLTNKMAPRTAASASTALENAIIGAAVEVFSDAHPGQGEARDAFIAALRTSMTTNSGRVEQVAEMLQGRRSLLPEVKAAYMLGTVPLEAIVKSAHRDALPAEGPVPSDDTVREQANFYTRLHGKLLETLQTYLARRPSQGHASDQGVEL